METLITNIFNGIQVLFDLVLDLVTGLLQLPSILNRCMGFVSYAMSMCPPVVSTVMVAMVSISAVYLIVGR